MSEKDQENEKLRAQLKSLKDWLEVLNREDPELRFRALVDRSSDGIALVDVQGLFLYNSPSIFALLGYLPAELLGRKYLELVHPEDRDARVALFADCVANAGKEVRGTMRCLHRDGSTRHIECIAVNRLDEPCVRGVVLNFRDVTPLLAAEAERRVSSYQQVVVTSLGLLARGTTSLDTLFEEAVRQVAAVLGVEFSMVLELVPPGDSFCLRAGVGWKEGYVGRSKFPVDPTSQMGYALAKTEPVIVTDHTTDTRFRLPPLLQEHEVGAGMCIAIIARDQPFGVLGVHTVRPRYFTPQDATFLQSVANLLGAAIDESRIELELRETERRFRLLLQQAPGVLVAIDRDGTIVLASQGAEQLFGYSQKELLGQPIEMLVPQRLWSVHVDHVRRYMEKPVVRALESEGTLHGRCKDGSEVTLEISLSPLQLGADLAIAAFIRDITAQKLAEQYAALQHAVAVALSESGSLDEAVPKILRSVCQTLDWDLGAIWVVDEVAGVLRCSDAWSQPGVSAPRFVAVSRDFTFCRGVGLPGRVWESAASRWIQDVTKDNNFPRAPTAERDNLHGAFAFPIKMASDVLAVMEFFSSEIRQPNQELLRLFDSIGSMLGQFLKRKQTELLLLRAQKLEAVGSLAGGIAHEFNNLLQAISGYTRYAMEELNAAEQPYQDLQQVIAATDRAANLTRQLLSFARTRPHEDGLVDLNQVLRDVESMLRPIIGSGIEVTLDLEDARAFIVGDAVQLHQAIMNLVINARDAMPQGGQLTMRTRTQITTSDDREWSGVLDPFQNIILTVTDSGCGMTAEVKTRVFEPFFTTKPVGQGTGLGMSIVYGTIRQHNGLIEIESYPGQGTEFKITLPAAAHAQGAVDQPDPPENQVDAFRGNETVLVAEDEDLLRDLLCRALQGAGYQVIAAKDGAEAMNLFQQHASSISIAVLDVAMPRLSGDRVAVEIRKLRPAFPVVLCTGFYASSLVSPDKEQITRVVTKPMEWKSLFEAMRQVLAAAKSETP